mgnify:CR=1 FL=1
MKGFGTADVETGRPVVATTLFQAASISKPVTAMIVLRAVQDGLLSLDADITTILKSWTPRQGEFGLSPITPRALLSHTSGAAAPRLPRLPPFAARPTLVDILDGREPSNVGPVFFERPPFTAFKYSGGGITIMQLALMDALARPFTEIARDSVLEPLGMDAEHLRTAPFPRPVMQRSRARP